MERLSALDAEFLHVEDGVGHMHIAGACTFDDPPPELSELLDLVASKLHHIPRYRQRVRSVPLDLGRPVWADDPHFELGYHVRHTALPAPGDDAAFRTLVGRLMSQPLDRSRPLWETWLVEGLEGGRWALVFKVHHCMVDGIAGVGLLAQLLDLEPHPDREEPVPWTPEREPPGALKVLDAWQGAVRDLAGTVAGVPRALTKPEAAVQGVLDTARGLLRTATSLALATPRSLGGEIGPHRTWAHSEASLADVKAVRRRFGGTVNDVVLAAVSGGYRALLESRGEDADDTVVRSLVPVSTRHEDQRGVTTNHVSMMLYELPVHVADPVERLELVIEQLGELKASHMVEAGDAVTRLGDLAPPMLMSGISRLVVRAMHRLPQRSVNTVTTNVPGPQFPLYCLGRRMTAYWPYVPITRGVRVGTAILSYDGVLSFGVTGDRATAPDVDVLARATTAEIAALLGRAGHAAVDAEVPGPP